ncbi:MAG: 50S ribosomal protein L4 [Candidatus Liptonbacteria bacterium]|nr:50S ribosomal protein L4 [Candidatus Liptonbacteria bacterium]
MRADVYNQANDKVGTVELPDGVFRAKWNPSLIQQVLIAQRANARRPWAHAKDRSEVRGGGRKPWRQKGTGRARHGSIRSPLWRGGGKSHGPLRERDYSQKVNKKMRRQAVKSVLAKKLGDHEVKFFDSIRAEEPKTRMLARALRPLLALPKKKKEFDVILVPEASEKNLTRAASNLPKTKVLFPQNLNVLDLLSYRHVFIDERAIPEIDKALKVKLSSGGKKGQE